MDAARHRKGKLDDKFSRGLNLNNIILSDVTAEMSLYYSSFLYGEPQDLNIMVAEGIDELGSLRAIEMTIGDVVCQKIPQPSCLSEKLLEAPHIRLPQV